MKRTFKEDNLFLSFKWSEPRSCYHLLYNTPLLSWSLFFDSIVNVRNLRDFLNDIIGQEDLDDENK